MMSESRESMIKLLRSLGAVGREDFFVLDGFDNEFYLKFDMSIDTDHPERSERTVDIHLKPVGCHPKDDDGFRVLSFANERHVLRFMTALGIERFSEKTRQAIYEYKPV